MSATCVTSTKMDDHMSHTRIIHHPSSHPTNNVGPPPPPTTSASINSATNGRSSNKHSFSISRFSLRRFLNPSYARTAALSNKRASQTQPSQQQQPKESQNGPQSDSVSNTDNKSVSNLKANLCPTYSSIDFESTSICSGRSEMMHPGTSANFRFSNSGGVGGATGGSSGTIECPLCLLELPSECFPELTTCSHRACFECMQKYLKIEISESRVNISCPECTEPVHPNDIRTILNDDTVMTKYESFMLRRVLVAEPDARWCPAPDCSYVVVASGCASCPKLKCLRPGCDTSFCYHCKQEWHPNQTCDAARAQRNHSLPYSQKPRASSVTFSQDSVTQRDDIKPCPCCKVLVIKMDDGSCNHMTCCVCGTEFCWLCMKEISDLHYLSPSGCTFWGKKPWSRKKKILWQLGMLIGAPVGIALIAGIAVPAIIIGIPVWVGRKLHARFQKQQSMSKHNKNLLVTTGVLTSILVSPILAAVAVGIGVPILLAYVYGVVPISLCRSGGCGVSTSPSGVRIELDEENDIGLNNPHDAVSVDTTLGINPTTKAINPSIDEVSFGMSTSLSMGSGTHLDRNGADRESASNAALAGSIASANACITGAVKLDVHSDSLSNKRYSLSSHSETASATVSLSERSTNFSFADDASTKALAGSIVGYRDVCIGTSTLAAAVTPVEVHIDAVNIVCSNEHSPCCCDDAVSNGSVKTAPVFATTIHRYVTQKVSEPDSVTDFGDGSGQSGSSKYVSFQTGARSKMSKFESRSLEQLTNYCEVCNKTHRPCCPNYNSVHKTSAQSSKSDKHKSKHGADGERKKVVVKHNTKFYHQESSRKGSIKSTHSDTTPVAKRHLEVKRVKSSDSHPAKSRKLSSRGAAKSTPTSPIGKIMETSSQAISKDLPMERAYQTSNNPIGSYSLHTNMKTKALYTAIDFDKCSN